MVNKRLAKNIIKGNSKNKINKSVKENKVNSSIDKKQINTMNKVLNEMSSKKKNMMNN